MQGPNFNNWSKFLRLLELLRLYQRVNNKGILSIINFWWVGGGWIKTCFKVLLSIVQNHLFHNNRSGWPDEIVIQFSKVRNLLTDGATWLKTSKSFKIIILNLKYFEICKMLIKSPLG